VLEDVNEAEETAVMVDALWGGHVFRRCLTLARRSLENSEGVTTSIKCLNDCIESKMEDVEAWLKDSGSECAIDVGNTIEETKGGDSML
jgi:hypothetical protein